MQFIKTKEELRQELSCEIAIETLEQLQKLNELQPFVVDSPERIRDNKREAFKKFLAQKTEPVSFGNATTENLV
jgi:hypothetical protein